MPTPVQASVRSWCASACAGAARSANSSVQTKQPAFWRGRQAYLLAGVAAVAVGLTFALFGHAWSALLPVAYLVLHYGAYRRMVIINKGKALNMVLGLTARNMLVYGLLVSIGFLVRT